MLAYIMVGTNNLRRSAKFYDAALAPLGFAPAGGDNRYIGYAPKNAPTKAKFYVTKPYNKKPATFGNGTMISLEAKSRRAVEAFHAAGIANGGTDDGKPGPRPAEASNYVAYVRDPDGNKICAYCAKTK
ncbi:MAG: VOC family protein [Dongiaceae bacterium]